MAREQAPAMKSEVNYIFFAGHFSKNPSPFDSFMARGAVPSFFLFLLFFFCARALQDRGPSDRGGPYNARRRPSPAKRGGPEAAARLPVELEASRPTISRG